MDVTTLVNPVGQNTTFSNGSSGVPELTVVTASGTANTFGSWVSLGTTPAYACNRLRIIGRSYNAAVGAIPALINLALGPSSTSLTPWISNIAVNSSGQYDSIPMGTEFPLFIPPNQQVWAQIAVNSTSLNNWEIGLFCDYVPGLVPLRKVTSYVDSAISSGNQFTVAATSGAWGPFTITSSFGPHRALLFGIQPAGNTPYYSLSLQLSFNGNILFPLSVVAISNNANSAMVNPKFGPYKVPFISGVTVAVSGYAMLGASDLIFQLPLYGLD